MVGHRLENIDPLFSYEFRDKGLLDRSLSHRSYSGKNNETFEFLGDAILSSIISSELLYRFPSASEGELTRMRASLVRGIKLAEIARKNDLGARILLGEGERKTGGWNRSSILANVVEALIGAIYLDSNYETVRSCVLSVFSEFLVDVDQGLQKDAKTLLQEHLQKLSLPLPRYLVAKIDESATTTIFTVECYTQLIDNPSIATGESRKLAEQKAAELTLRELKVI